MTDTGTLRTLAEALDGEFKLAGPWGWFGDTNHQPPYLATVHGGRVFVLGTEVRSQMSTQVSDEEYDTVDLDCDELELVSPEGLSHTAHITFPHRREGDRYSVMTRADKMPIFEVAPNALDASDPAVYRTQITGVRNSVATYLAAVDPTTVLGLLDRIADLETQLAGTA